MININGTEWTDLTSADIVEAIKANDESFFYEFKDDGVEKKKLVEEITAFANSFGGYIFIGVSDKKEIVGCNEWNEQRVFSVIHDSISPIPLYDVRIFETEKGEVLVIRVDEGPEPPYITNRGKIYERVVANSCVINDANRLYQLSEKRKDNMRKIEETLSIPSIKADDGNIMGYIDVGFKLITRNVRAIKEKIVDANIMELGRKIKEERSVANVYKVGGSIVVVPFRASSNSAAKDLPAEVNSFMEIMNDGSVRFRLLLLREKEGSNVNLYVADLFRGLFVSIYKLVFGDSILSEFVCAKKVEKLVVNKQFSPKYFLPDECIIDDDAKNMNGRFLEQMKQHDALVGEDVYVSSNRIPPIGLLNIDKAFFERGEIEYTNDNIIWSLFTTGYTYLPYVE